MNRALVGDFQQLGPQHRVDFAFDRDFPFEPVDLAGPPFRYFAAVAAVLGGHLAMPDGDADPAELQFLCSA